MLSTTVWVPFYFYCSFRVYLGRKAHCLTDVPFASVAAYIHTSIHQHFLHHYRKTEKYKLWNFSEETYLFVHLEMLISWKAVKDKYNMISTFASCLSLCVWWNMQKLFSNPMVVLNELDSDFLPNTNLFF